MSKVTRAEWYRRVNATWPSNIPRLSDAEAISAGRKLYRFAMKRTFKGPVRVTTGNRYTWIRRGEMIVNPGHGWHGLVHLLSHYCHDRLHPNDVPHGSGHARSEIRMIKAVISRGWLDGKLRKVAKPVPPPPTREQKLADEQAKLLAARKRWTTKAKRAQTALRKIDRRLNRLRKIVENSSCTAPDMTHVQVQ